MDRTMEEGVVSLLVRTVEGIGDEGSHAPVIEADWIA